MSVRAFKAMKRRPDGTYCSAAGAQTYLPGKTYRVDGHPVMCAHGFHACIKAIDCFRPAYGYLPTDPIVHVVMRGEIIHSPPKSCCTVIDIGEVLTLDERRAVFESGPVVGPGAKTTKWRDEHGLLHRTSGLPALEDPVRRLAVWATHGQWDCYLVEHCPVLEIGLEMCAVISRVWVSMRTGKCGTYKPAAKHLKTGGRAKMRREPGVQVVNVHDGIGTLTSGVTGIIHHESITLLRDIHDAVLFYWEGKTTIVIVSAVLLARKILYG